MKNKGISLITLVITIIIMIILAGAIILTLTQSGIFDKANDATDMYSLKQVQAIADLAWSEAYADNKRDRATLQTAVDEALKANGLEGKYTAIADEKGVTVSKVGDQGNGGQGGTSNVPTEWQENVSEVTTENVPIPKGFVVSPYGAHDDFKAENTRDGGLVIYALTPEEIEKSKTEKIDILAIDGKNGELTLKEAHYASMETRNQFVWVPVDKNNFATKFVRTEYYIPRWDEYQTPSNTLGSGYWELVVDDKNMPADNTKNTTNYVSKYTLDEAIEMYNSVAEYGGFYIARYEVGKDSQGKTSITMGKYPYNYVDWGEAMIEDADDNGAVSQSRAFYPKDNTNYGVVSTLTYGVQWDTILNWWKELDPSLDLNDSTSYGNYYKSSIAKDDEKNEYNENAQYSEDYSESWNEAVAGLSDGWLLTTGAYKNANVNNIYDMAGNLYEWTMEGISRYGRACRGGAYTSTGDACPVFDRSDVPGNFDLPNGETCDIGFRPSLYIKK